MTSTKLASTAARDRPGLPRGRGRLDPEIVQADQQERILRAVLLSVAEKGYLETTIGDIISGARVSRAAFYRLYDSKVTCFVAALEWGRQILIPMVAAAVSDRQGRSVREVLATFVAGYLQCCADQPEFTRAWMVELPTAGPEARAVRDRWLDELAHMLATIDRGGDGVGQDTTHYVGLVGGANEIVYRLVVAGRTRELPQIADKLMTFLCSGLQSATEGS